MVGYSLIIMPDMSRYAGDGAGIKAITGGDKVAIDPKHKAPYSTRIPAVILAVNNNAMSFSDRSGDQQEAGYLQFCRGCAGE